MPPIEVGPTQAIGQIPARPARPSGGDELNGIQPPATPAAGSTQAQVQATPSVETSAALDAGEAPVDTDRVQVIRRAVEQGNYPLVPTQIADAMIAAGVLLRSPK